MAVMHQDQLTYSMHVNLANCDTCKINTLSELRRGDALLNAAKTGKMDDLRACLDSGTDIESRDGVRSKNMGWTF